MNNKYICYVAGKSGGHIIPALTHAQNFLGEHSEYKLVFFSADQDLDKKIIDNYTCIDYHKKLVLDNVPRKKMLAWPGFILQLLRVFWFCLTTLVWYRPVKVVSMGGYLSIPVCITAWLLRIPYILYELNVVPGQAVLLLSRFAQYTSICFEESRTYFPRSASCRLTHYPLRYRDNDRIDRNQACQELGIDSEKKVVFVIGGSQGSQFINACIEQWIERCTDKKQYWFIHQTGVQEVDKVKALYQKNSVPSIVFGYRHDLNYCYSAADYIITRAGAGTLFEILFFKKPALIIPLETFTTSHQKNNAYAMEQAYPQLFSVILQNKIQENPLLLHIKI